MALTLTTFEAVLVAVSVVALVVALYYAVVERTQDRIVFRLRDDARALRDTLLTRTDLDPDVEQLLFRFNPRYITGSRDESVTLHKRHVRICTTPDPLATEEENHAAALFALLHEMAHVMSPEWGHAENFWQNFAVLLREARRIGLYDQATLDRVLGGDPGFNLCGHHLSRAYLPDEMV